DLAVLGDRIGRTGSIAGARRETETLVDHRRRRVVDAGRSLPRLAGDVGAGAGAVEVAPAGLRRALAAGRAHALVARRAVAVRARRGKRERDGRSAVGQIDGDLCDLSRRWAIETGRPERRLGRLAVGIARQGVTRTGVAVTARDT